MKNVPSYIYVIFIGVALTMILVMYFTFDTKQNEKTYFLNETIATHVTSNVDLGLARVHEEVYLDKVAFEAAIVNDVTKNYPDASIQVEYLEKSNGAIKAIKAKMSIAEEKFTSTYKVSEI